MHAESDHALYRLKLGSIDATHVGPYYICAEAGKHQCHPRRIAPHLGCGRAVGCMQGRIIAYRDCDWARLCDWRRNLAPLDWNSGARCRRVSDLRIRRLCNGLIYVTRVGTLASQTFARECAVGACRISGSEDSVMD